MDDLSKCYWNSTGPLQAHYDRYYDELVPARGKCDTVQGELLRAVSRIMHDWYNNGFGNNTTGAVRYIEKYFPTANEHREVLSEVMQCMACGNFGHETALEQLCNDILLYISASTPTGFTPNTVDMFDLEEDIPYEEDEDPYENDDDEES